MSLLELFNKNDDLVLFFDQLKCPLLLLTFDGLIAKANKTAIKILKLNPNAYLNTCLQKHCFQNNFSSLLKLYDKRNSLDEIKESYLIEKKNLVISWTIHLLDSQNKKCSILLMGQDITKEESSIEDLQDTIFFYEGILSKLPTNVYWKDENCVYMGCNDRLATVMGLPSRDAIKGMTDFDFDWGKGAAESFIAFDKKIMQTGKPQSTEDVFKEASGKIVTVLTNKTPLKDKNEKTIGVLAISVDITERKEMEAKLIKAKAAEAANKVKLDFISNMQHDLRTPFAGISAVVMMLHEMETEPDKKSLLEELLKSCTQWEAVHHQIIAVLSIKEPQAIRKEWVSISNELSKIRESLLSTLRIKALDFFIDPIPEELDKIETDRLKFNTIFSNLIGNAIKFTEKGSVRVTVTYEKSTYKIEVIDTGIGIPDDKLDYIFEQFTKLSNSNKHSDFKGVGLGLYSSRQTAIELGGNIQVRSKLGEGSVFIVTLPCQDKSER